MNLIKAFALLFLTAACSDRTNNIDGLFVESGNRAYRTNQFGRTYELKRDGTFTFTDGSGPKRTISGTYVISDNKIFLSPDTDFLTQNIRVKLKIINPGCVRDYDNIFYCTDTLQCENLTKEENRFREETVSILDTLQEVKEERKYLDQVNEKFLEDYPEKLLASDIYVDYGGIFIVDKRELHLFEYVKTCTRYHNPRQHFLRLLVQKEPFKIYRLNNSDDSLKLVY